MHSGTELPGNSSEDDAEEDDAEEGVHACEQEVGAGETARRGGATAVERQEKNFAGSAQSSLSAPPMLDSEVELIKGVMGR